MIDVWETKTWWEMREHPHRQIIVDLLRETNPESVLELGCGYGQNLYNIKKAFPNARVVGIDENRLRIVLGKSKMEEEGLDIKMSIGNIFTEEFPEKSFDVVLTDATLLMIKMTEEEIKSVIQKIVKTARKMIVLVEWHNFNVKLPGLDVGERFVRNYVELLNMFGVKDIKLRKITEEEWASPNWHTVGFFITAKL